MASRIRLYSDMHEENGKEYEIAGFYRREKSTAIEFDVVVNPYTTRKMVVPASEVEWLDEE